MHGPVDAATIVKGYEYGPGQHLVLEPEDLDPLRPAQNKALRLERFLDLGHLDLLLLSGRSLHLLPDGVAAEHAYDVLREAMAQHRRLAVGRIVLGGHHQVVAVIAAGCRPDNVHQLKQILLRRRRKVGAGHRLAQAHSTLAV